MAAFLGADDAVPSGLVQRGVLVEIPDWII